MDAPGSLTEANPIFWRDLAGNPKERGGLAADGNRLRSQLRGRATRAEQSGHCDDWPGNGDPRASGHLAGAREPRERGLDSKPNSPSVSRVQPSDPSGRSRRTERRIAVTSASLIGMFTNCTRALPQGAGPGSPRAIPTLTVASARSSPGRPARARPTGMLVIPASTLLIKPPRSAMLTHPRRIVARCARAGAMRTPWFIRVR
jgi:hypothetical protein